MNHAAKSMEIEDIEVRVAALEEAATRRTDRAVRTRTRSSYPRREGNLVRYGSVLQRRLVQLESAIKVPTVKEQWAAIQVEALRRISLRDLRIMRDVVVRQAVLDKLLT